MMKEWGFIADYDYIVIGRVTGRIVRGTVGRMTR